MNFLKKNYKLIIGIIIGAILISGISVYATGQYLASQVTYKDGKTVADALDNLYEKVNVNIPLNVKYAKYDQGYNTSFNHSYSFTPKTSGKLLIVISGGRGEGESNKALTYSLKINDTSTNMIASRNDDWGVLYTYIGDVNANEKIELSNSISSTNMINLTTAVFYSE